MPQQQQDMDRDFIFQQGGACPHFHCEVTSYLNRTVFARIGHGRMIAWPPQSPDLTPLDSTLCGYIKDSFCSTTSCNFGRTMGTSNGSGCDYRCRHDS